MIRIVDVIFLLYVYFIRITYRQFNCVLKFLCFSKGWWGWWVGGLRGVWWHNFLKICFPNHFVVYQRYVCHKLNPRNLKIFLFLLWGRQHHKFIDQNFLHFLVYVLPWDIIWLNSIIFITCLFCDIYSKDFERFFFSFFFASIWFDQIFFFNST